VSRALEALTTPDLGLALEVAEEAKKEKGDLALRLTALASALAATAVTKAPENARDADVAASRYQLALTALEQLDGNASAQMVVESLLIRMRGA
jgi:hypothetical protein